MGRESSGRPKVLIVYAGHKEVNVEREVLEAYGAEVIAVISPQTTEAQAALGHCDALMVTIQPVTAEMMDAMPNCKIICRIGTGLDAIDIPAAAKERSLSP